LEGQISIQVSWVSRFSDSALPYNYVTASSFIAPLSYACIVKVAKVPALSVQRLERFTRRKASHPSEFQQQKSVKANDHDRSQLLHHLAPSRSTGQVRHTAIIESNAYTYIWIIATLREEKSIRVINFQVRRVVHERKSGRARRQKNQKDSGWTFYAGVLTGMTTNDHLSLPKSFGMS
jgi:hypothetical protein